MRDKRRRRTRVTIARWRAGFVARGRRRGSVSSGCGRSSGVPLKISKQPTSTLATPITVRTTSITGLSLTHS
jgi:hypothetical protein